MPPFPSSGLVPIPPGVNEREAAAAMLQGMTAHYLSHDTYPLKQGQTALVHAAAGGVWTPAGTDGTQHWRASHCHGFHGGEGGSWRAPPARTKSSCTRSLILKPKTKHLTDGKGVDIIYDSVGKTTFEKGLNVLRRAG